MQLKKMRSSIWALMTLVMTQSATIGLSCVDYTYRKHLSRKWHSSPRAHDEELLKYPHAPISKLRWAEHGEKPTKYFFNLEAKKFAQKTIVELKISENKTIIKDAEILKQIENFYQDLYTSQFTGSNDLFDNFVEDVVLPQLSKVDKNKLEGELSAKECRQILKMFSNWEVPWGRQFHI